MKEELDGEKKERRKKKQTQVQKERTKREGE